MPSKAENKPESKVENKVESKVESKAESKAESKMEDKAESKTEDKVVAEEVEEKEAVQPSAPVVASFEETSESFTENSKVRVMSCVCADNAPCSWQRERAGLWRLDADCGDGGAVMRWAVMPGADRGEREAVMSGAVCVASAEPERAQGGGTAPGAAVEGEGVSDGVSSEQRHHRMRCLNSRGVVGAYPRVSLPCCLWRRSACSLLPAPASVSLSPSPHA